MPNIKKNSFCTTWNDEFGITHVEYLENTDLDLDKAKELVELLSDRTNNENKIYLVKDLRNINCISTEAMTYLASRPIKKIVAAEALIVDNLSSRLLVNFFIKKFVGLDFDCKKFDNKTDAFTWVLSKKQQLEN